MKILNLDMLKTVLAFCFLLLISVDVSAYGKINLDYDGKADFLVFRRANGTWYGYSAETGGNFTARWGLPTDKPVPADYTGDEKADLRFTATELGRFRTARPMKFTHFSSLFRPTRLFPPIITVTV